MIKIAFIVGFIIVGILAIKFVDTTKIKKGMIAFGVLLLLGIVGVIISELIR
ncbi:hypothetical protein [Candidatus Enterovibrio escicola]|uniref:Uncharacterized protein n=1 Tax=Candidatus Enterovibrio escicola TaxID=1927127 RepID=A0A2A5T4B1_9GAMM|nr:hypothetical protein [Candidatus Enterovibrio escacola]PCS23002.1 hypothetical protein BTN49_1562 [Candidatus Enterovibrio escacola]